MEYMIAAYILVAFGLAGYGIWRQAQLAQLRREVEALRRALGSEQPR